MINYTSQYQTQFEDFSNLCQLELNPNNRWIQMGALLSWDRMVEVYMYDADSRISLNQIKAKLQSTSETWIAATLFVLNLSAFAARSGVPF